MVLKDVLVNLRLLSYNKNVRSIRWKRKGDENEL